VARLESQVVRFQTAAETAERSEEDLKSERRKLQREVKSSNPISLNVKTFNERFLIFQLREATTRIDELETANKHLETRLGKLKTAKSNLLKDL
jgi:hypothetical protein